MDSFPHAGPVRIMPSDWLRPLPLETLYPRRAPLEVDVGSGKAKFLLARAVACPTHNYLGIERMLRRLRKTVRKVERLGLTHVRLLRVDARYGLRYLLPPGTVRTFYIFFPDPWPKKRHHGNRLLDAGTRDALLAALEPDGTVHFATDHEPYAEEVEALFSADPRWSAAAPYEPPDAERTDFEAFFAPESVRRLAFRKRDEGCGE